MSPRIIRMKIDKTNDRTIGMGSLWNHNVKECEDTREIIS